jgi:hypothetical protein
VNFDWKTHNWGGTCEKCGGPCQRKYTHDADGNLVDGEYWSWMEETFQKAVQMFRGAGNAGATAIALRLVETADDVPAELVQRQQDFWNESAEFDDVNDVPDAMWGIPEDIQDQMIGEVGRGTYAPATATEFITEHIRRVNEAQRARPWIWPLHQLLT